MERNNTVPTAIAFIGFVAIFLVVVFLVRGNVDRNKIESIEKEAAEVGELPDMRVFIGGKTFTAKADKTKVAKSFQEHLPLILEMNDNDDGKVGVVYFKFITNDKILKEVQAGDILVYGGSEVVIVFKTHKVNDKYTKIGHIDNISEVPSGEVGAKISIIE